MSTYREHLPTEPGASAKRSSRDEKAAEQSQLHDDVKKTKSTCEDIQDTLHRFVGLEAKLDKLTKDGEDASALEDRIEISEHWRRVGQLEGELQKAKQGEQEARAKLSSFDQSLAEAKAKEMLVAADARKELHEVRRERDQAVRRLEDTDRELKNMTSELRNKKDAIREMDRKAGERCSGEIGADRSNQSQRVRDLERASEVFEHRNLDLENEITKLTARNRELEQKLTAENHVADGDKGREAQLKASFDAQAQALEQQSAELEEARQRFEQQVKEFKARDRSAQVDKENKKLREMVQEQKRLLSDLESELRQERNVASLPTPKDYLRMVKLQEGEGFSRQNARHVFQKKTLERVTEACQQALARHLPPASKAVARKELEGMQLIF